MAHDSLVAGCCKNPFFPPGEGEVRPALTLSSGAGYSLAEHSMTKREEANQVTGVSFALEPQTAQ